MTGAKRGSSLIGMMTPRQPPRVLRLAAVLLLLACHGQTGEELAAAARADSSAAGYQVGSETSRPDSGVAGRMDSLLVAARRDSIRRDSARRDSLHRDSLRVATVKRDSARLAARIASAPRDSVRTATRRADSVHAAARDTTRAVTVAAGPVRVNDFLTYDARSRTASVQLVAGYNGVNGSLNYNGATRGTRVLAIPLGWHVHVTVTNRDTDLQHSAIVVEAVLPPPLELTTPAFPGAALPRLDEGLHEDETGTMDFTATHAGRYMLACGVPGHAQSGMWLQLAVSAGLSVPAYR